MPRAAGGRVRLRLLALWLVSEGLPDGAAAQQVSAFHLRFDNDILAVRGTGPPPDHDYTHGVELAARFRTLPRPLRRWIGAEVAEGGGAPRTWAGLSIGQRIYTPRLDGPEPVPGERPYAGWLYAGAEVLVTRGGTEHRLAVEVGTTGPAALGEPVQNGFHRLVGSTRQEGWDHQLPWEPGVLLRYAAAWPRELGGMLLRPSAEAGVGTVWTGLAGGLSVRLGAEEEGPKWHAEGRVRQEWVARNLFLDGSTFRESVRAERRDRVSEAAVGLGYGFARWGAEYSFVVRGREYEGQARPHGYGSLALTWRR
ncbi:MAG TPA: lipid A deacylase LpxR family protein [Longimicrobiaceae bacterium]|nr:lipid A deacylase LpxR family protein [Longimicrobiaceae bacterium]